MLNTTKTSEKLIPRTFDQQIQSCYPEYVMQGKIIPMLVKKLNKVSQDSILLANGEIDPDFNSYLSDKVLIKSKVNSEGQRVLHIELGNELKFDYCPGYDKLETNVEKQNPVISSINRIREIQPVTTQSVVTTLPELNNFEFSDAFQMDLSSSSISSNIDPLDAFISSMS